MKKYTAIYMVLLAAAVAHSAYYYSIMPATMASKFNFEGHPVGMMSRDLFFGIYLGVMILIVVAFLVNARLIPRLPAKLVNIPNKDYWLAPERQEKTLKDMQNHILQFGAISQIFLIAVIHTALDANLGKQAEPLTGTALLPMIVAYVAYVLGWSGFLVVRYMRIPARR